MKVNIQKPFVAYELRKKTVISLIEYYVIFLTSYVILVFTSKVYLYPQYFFPALIGFSIFLISFYILRIKHIKIKIIHRIMRKLAEEKIEKHDELLILLKKDMKLALGKVQKVLAGKYVSKDAYVRHDTLILNIYNDLSTIDDKEDALLEIYNEIKK